MAAMKDEDLTGLLEKMPRRTASSAFTERVLQRLDEHRPRQPRGRWYVAVAAVAACVMVVGLLVGPTMLREQAERRAHAERLERMREEYRTLQFELDELRALAFEAEPVLQIGGTEQVDFVIDLRRLGGHPVNVNTQPTSHSR